MGKNRFLIFLTILFTLSLFIMIDCGEEQAGEGKVEGKITGPDGETPVANATVGISSKISDTVFYEDNTKSNADGVYTFEDVPDGDYVITAEKGHFYGEIEIKVVNGSVEGETDIEVSIDADKIAVVPGLFDDIGAILKDMEINYTEITDADLEDWDKVSSFYIIFLNCGSETDYAAESEVQENLRNFVKGGGSIYASDYDYEYIEYTWPNAIDFYGDDLTDPKIGEGDQHVNGDVVDTELRDYMGKSVVDLYYNLGAWVVIEDVGTGTKTDIQGDIITYEGKLYDKPLLVNFTDDNGKVIYTTFHNEAQVTYDAEKILKYFVFEM
ncbi:MAG: carboxypeptidase-like regulatory domain-containing protein [bacterium]